MDVGDFIFIFIAILIILGRVLSFVFRQFVENKPAERTDQSSSKPQSIKDYVVDWLRSIEDHIESNQWNKQTEDNEWKAPANEYYDPLETPEFASEKQPATEKQADKIIQPKSIVKKPQQKRMIQKKYPFRQINLKKAIIHYEIFSPPISLRQEHPYDRQGCPK